MRKKTRRPRTTDRSSARPHINWKTDMDYLHLLPEAEKAWLEKFTGEYYRNATKTDVLTQDQRREAWRAEAANRRDLFTRYGVDAESSGIMAFHAEFRSVTDSSGDDSQICENIDQDDARARADEAAATLENYDSGE